MNFVRYSAVEMFGIPLDGRSEPSPEDALQLQSRGLELVSAYNLEPQEVPSEPTDITPYYWQKNSAIYYASLVSPDGPAIIEVLPKYPDTVLASSKENFRGLQDNQPGSPLRTIVIPKDGEIFALVGGGSPRFSGKICLHELIAQID